MMEQAWRPVSNIENALSDYRFCVYRLSVLKEGPEADGPVAGAVVARIERLLAEYPAIEDPGANLLRINPVYRT